MKKEHNYEKACVRTEFGNTAVYTFPMKVKDVVEVHYVAVRGRDSEEGAVQRVLSKRRVSDIKKFILKGNMFFNTFILNWTNKDDKPIYNDGSISVPVKTRSAQVIDGQHRLAGLQAAMKDKESIGKESIIVSLCIGLSTKEAAAIFLNINTEQKPAPKSLIYDLFGEVVVDSDHVINRAKDIAKELNENPDSPFCEQIRYPGAKRGVGRIDLSTVVSCLKKHLGPDGVFVRLNVTSLNYQEIAIMNYFLAIKSYYDQAKLWDNNSKNPFFRSAGFVGAIEYLTSRLLMKCAEKKSFTVNTFKTLLNLDKSQLLVHEDIKGLDGKTARKKIRDHLETNLLEDLPPEEDYEF